MKIFEKSMCKRLHLFLSIVFATPLVLGLLNALSEQFLCKTPTMASLDPDLERIARAYYDAFNRKDLSALTPMFAPDASLTDWEVGTVYGKEEVLRIHREVLQKAPNIHFEVLKLHCAAGGRGSGTSPATGRSGQAASRFGYFREKVTRSGTVTAELSVSLHDEGNTVLRICDVLEVDVESGCFTSLRAYLG